MPVALPPVSPDRAMRVLALTRYPVKSLGGEPLDEGRIEPDRVEGDRKLALYDPETCSLVSLKNARRWPGLLGVSARERSGIIEILFPSGEGLDAESPAAQARLSQLLDREILVVRHPPEGAVLLRQWPPVPGLAPPQVRAAATPAGPDVTAGPFGLFAPGTFFDAAAIHIVFTSSLRLLSAWTGRTVEADRFRPNLLIETPDSDALVEDALVGASLRVGQEVVLRLDLHTPRCIVPTLPIGDHPANTALLRVLAGRHRRDVADLGLFACFGAYATVVCPGLVACGDPVIVA